MEEKLNRIIKGLITLFGNTERIEAELKRYRRYKIIFFVQLGIIIVIILALLILNIEMLKLIYRG